MFPARRFVPQLAAILLVPTLAAQSPAPARLLTRPIKEVLLTKATVSGVLLAGVMVSSSGSPKEGAPWLTVAGAAPAKSRLCVTVQSADGRYRAEKIEYELERAAADAGVELPFERETQYAAYVAGLDRDQIAVLATPDECGGAIPAKTRAAIWRDGPGTGTRRLRVAMITGGRTTKMTWEAKGGSPNGMVDCRQIKGTAFDAWCEAVLPDPAPPEVQVLVTSYRLNGRPLEPIKFSVTIGR
jgi:hypothetical protein